MTGRYFFSVILLICVATAAALERCPYTFVTKTGTQEAGATSDFRVDLHIDYQRPILSNISQYNFLGREYKSFQSNAVDVFDFNATCVLHCDMAIYFHGSSDDSSWTVDAFKLLAFLTDTNFDYTYRHSFTLRGKTDYHPFNVCDEAVGAKQQKLTGASPFRLVGLPSYTT